MNRIVTARIAIVVSLLALLALCVGGSWASVQALTSPFIASGASDIQVTDTGFGERVITYHMPNPDDGWQTDVARRLSLSGWSLARDRNQWGGTETIVSLGAYTRTAQLWFVTIEERAELQGDRSEARIIVQYVVTRR